MFTGIIQEIGKVREVKSLGGGVRLIVEAHRSLPQLRIGDSVAINGVCQTVIERRDADFAVEAVEETLSKTTLGELVVGTRVNLETALEIGSKLGGHLVQGHVDGVGIVRTRSSRVNSWMIAIEIPEQLTRYVIPVGSIAIDGVSLTVASLQGSVVTVSVIPHTMENTTLSDVRPGSRVNIESDLIGKYVERLTAPWTGKGSPGSITIDRLKGWGYDQNP